MDEHNFTVSLQDVTGISYDDKHIYLLIQKSGRQFSLPMTKDDFHKMFPTLIKTKDGSFGLTSYDRKCFLEIDKNNKKLVDALGLCETQINVLENNTKDNRYYNIVKDAGLADEYCLMFGGQIMFHSKSREEIDAHKAQHPYFCFSEYVPNIYG